jgi:hypothetical protein
MSLGTETDSERRVHSINTTDMTKLHPSNGHQIMTEPFSYTRLVTEASERRSVERTSDSAPLLNRSIHRWEMFVIWNFVVVSFAAFFFCLWAISAKCHGDWPFGPPQRWEAQR